MLVQSTRRTPLADPTGPALLLRLEGAALLLGAALLYGRLGASWLAFAVLLLAPDLAMLGYLAGPRIGAALYNLVHALPLPALLAAAGLVGDAPWLVAAALIWLAHVGMDRAVGYGLKYPTGPEDTHLDRV
jgi:Domain of unknown function (DUF4260)